jgi:hypothetical protein
LFALLFVNQQVTSLFDLLFFIYAGLRPALVNSQAASERELLFSFTPAEGRRLSIRKRQASVNYFFHLRRPKAGACQFASGKRA